MLGDKIREARKRQGITLNQLAEASGLTASYISQAERNLTEPSLSSLRKLAAALQLPLYFFLDEEVPQTQVIRADQRRKLAIPGSGVVYEYLSPVSALETGGLCPPRYGGGVHHSAFRRAHCGLPA